ncbi:MAG: succinate dehydrogenase, hydrophobic membrane anchor protein [Gammaproteobacteria bacterium]|nr:MAG: succinate dehydrogenase, hydrophobic membrane anchor protein [Gammaproteobacteria bacterium]
MKNTRFRTPLKIAKGHGSAKSGTGHWINQRVTAIALVPLVFLFVCTLMTLLTAQSYEEVAMRLSNPFWATALIVFILVGFYHGALGIQVILEDYVAAEMPKMLLLIGLRLAAGFLAVLGTLSVLFIALS